MILNEGAALFAPPFGDWAGKYDMTKYFSKDTPLAGLDQQKCGLHDRLSDTRVVYAKKIKEIHIENENTGFLL